MKIKKKYIIIIVLLIIIIFFYPRPSGQGGICLECLNTTCNCFGFKKSVVYAGPWHDICYGVPYNCDEFMWST